MFNREQISRTPTTFANSLAMRSSMSRVKNRVEYSSHAPETSARFN